MNYDVDERRLESSDVKLSLMEHWITLVQMTAYNAGTIDCVDAGSRCIDTLFDAVQTILR